MLYYTITNDVSEPVRKAAIGSTRCAARCLGRTAVMPRFIRKCSKSEWVAQGAIPFLSEASGLDVAGTCNRMMGVFLNADLPPSQIVPTAIHEFHHYAMYEHNPHTRMSGTVNERIAEEHAAHFVQRVLGMIQTAMAYRATMANYEQVYSRKIWSGSRKDLLRYRMRHYAAC